MLWCVTYHSTCVDNDGISPFDNLSMSREVYEEAKRLMKRLIKKEVKRGVKRQVKR